MDGSIAPIVNFLVVFGALGFVLRKPVAKTFQERSKTVSDKVNAADKAAAKANQELRTWEDKWNAADNEIASYRKDTEERMKLHHEKAIQEAAEEAARIAKEATLVAQSEAVRAMQSVEREVIERVVGSARSFFRTNLSDGDKHSVVKDYLERVHGSR